MRINEKVVCAAVALMSFSVSHAVADTSTACQAKSGRLTARVQCLTTIVESLKGEVEGLRQSEVEGLRRRDEATTAVKDQVSQLLLRMAAIEGAEHKKDRDGAVLDAPKSRTLSSTANTPNVAAPKPGVGPFVLYEGEPLIKLPSRLNGVAGVQGLPDTQSGDVGRPPQ